MTATQKIEKIFEEELQTVSKESRQRIAARIASELHVEHTPLQLLALSDKVYYDKEREDHFRELILGFLGDQILSYDMDTSSEITFTLKEANYEINGIPWEEEIADLLLEAGYHFEFYFGDDNVTTLRYTHDIE